MPLTNEIVNALFEPYLDQNTFVHNSDVTIANQISISIALDCIKCNIGQANVIDLGNRPFSTCHLQMELQAPCSSHLWTKMRLYALMLSKLHMGCEFSSPLMVYKATSAQGISSTLKINDLPGATCKWSRKRLLGFIFGPKRVCTHFSNQNCTWDFDSLPPLKLNFHLKKLRF